MANADVVVRLDVADRRIIAAMDDVLLAAADGRPLPTAAIDRLPPWRARLVTGYALKNGATLEEGTPEAFEAATAAAGLAGRHEPGWWRQALAGDRVG